MPRGTVVKVDRVVPFAMPGIEDIYVSKMLVDESNSGSPQLQVNYGAVQPGASLPPGDHPEPYDEIYYVLGGEAVLNLDGVDYDLEKDMLVFIPAGTSHALTNKSQTDEFTILTIWPKAPEPGANGVYDARKEAWGETYREMPE